MEFKEYKKIYSLTNSDWEFREETAGILEWTCYIQEKIDWANLSIWKKNGEIMVGSRRQDVSSGSFRWAVEYCRSHKGIKSLLDTLEGDRAINSVRLYGEWLVPHTITNYNSLSYNIFYMFDIEINNEKMDIEKVENLAKQFDINFPTIFARIDSPPKEEIDKWVWQSTIWPKGEGVVIKNMTYVNKWWDNCYAKIVAPEFKEENAIVFGNHQKGDVEMKLANKYCVVGRVRKVINKIEQERDVDISKAHIKEIIGRMQHDIITEEAWNIQKEGVVSFRKFKGLIWKKTGRIVIDLIEGNEESVAFS